MKRQLPKTTCTIEGLPLDNRGIPHRKMLNSANASFWPSVTVEAIILARSLTGVKLKVEAVLSAVKGTPDGAVRVLLITKMTQGRRTAR